MKGPIRPLDYVDWLGSTAAFNHLYSYTVTSNCNTVSSAVCLAHNNVNHRNTNHTRAKVIRLYRFTVYIAAWQHTQHTDTVSHVRLLPSSVIL